jgi:CheY-like chemotaxis protein
MDENKKIKVLLVDDEESFARALSERLSTRGVAAEAVFGGREALELIDRDEPDVMILDLKMPEIDGMEVLRRVRKRYPNIQTIVLSGYGTDSARKEAARLGAVDFLDKPADIYILAEKIRAAFAAKNSQGTLYTYGGFVPLLKKHFNHEGISLGENALGIKCFCRDDNQDQLGYLLMSTGRNSGWFDLNAFGAYPAGRSVESLGPPSHHIPELQNDPWTVVFHATHVGCDSTYTLGMTDRYGMLQPSSSCGLLAAILNRHGDRRQGKEPPAFKDFEMAETERALLVHLDDILNSPHPMASAAEKLFDLGAGIFDALLRENGGRYFYIGGINVDYDAERPENNFFVPKTICIYEDAVKRELELH